MSNGSDDGFLGRWSRRKVQVRGGKPVEPEAPPAPLPQVAPSASSTVAAPAFAASPEEPAPPTMEDTLALSPQSDFKPFMARNVAPDVKNAAMKKLFADPHFNVMDMMDVYVDDYSKPDPIPESMLRQMVSAKFLKLFDEEEEKPKNSATRDDADDLAAQSVAQSDPEPAEQPNEVPHQLAPPAAGTDTNDHTDMQLQPDDAAQRESLRSRAE
jgi:Protein of unknown function (DUF3306)